MCTGRGHGTCLGSDSGHASVPHWVSLCATRQTVRRLRDLGDPGLLNPGPLSWSLAVSGREACSLCEAVEQRSWDFHLIPVLPGRFKTGAP